MPQGEEIGAESVWSHTAPFLLANGLTAYPSADDLEGDAVAQEALAAQMEA